MISPRPWRGSSGVAVPGPGTGPPDGRTTRGPGSCRERCPGTDQRLPELEVEVDRARAARPVGRLREGAGRQGSPRRFLTLGRHARRGGPASGGAEETHLLDGLRRSRVVQLRRPVRRADDERHPGVVRLDDRRVQLRGGRAARDADDGRPPRRHRQPNAKNPALRSSRRTWTRSRSASGSASGVDREPGQTTASVTPSRGPLVDQGGAEGGLYAHPACPSMSKCAVPGRRWSCCTASPRPGASGAASETFWPTSHTLVAVDLPGHGDSGTVRADLPATADLVAEAVRTAVGDEPCDLLGYSLGARVALHVAIGADLPLRRLVFIGVTAGIEDPAGPRAPTPSPTRPWLTSSRPRATWSTSSTPGCSGPMFERLARGDAGRDGAPAQHRVRAGVEPPAVRGGDAGAPLGPSSDARLPRAGHGRVGRHPLRLACAPGRPPGASRPSRPWFPGVGTPCTLRNPSRPAGSCVTGSAMRSRAAPDGLPGTASQQQPDREERAGERSAVGRSCRAWGAGPVPPGRSGPGGAGLMASGKASRASSDHGR